MRYYAGNPNFPSTRYNSSSIFNSLFLLTVRRSELDFIERPLVIAYLTPILPTHSLMLTTNLQKLEVAAIKPMLHLLQWLEECFAAKFCFAARDSTGVWRELSKQQFLDEPGRELCKEEVQACEQASGTKLPQVILRGGGEAVLAMPLGKGSADFRIALGVMNSGDPSALLRMAQLWQTASLSKQQVEQAQSENEHFAEQLIEGLEELTFVRSMVEQLDVSATTNDLLTLAKSTLPLLNNNVKAQSLTLLLIDDSNQPLQATPVLSIGPNPVSDATAQTLLQRYGTTALEHPVVKNHLHQAAIEDQIPGVREFTLVPLASHSRRMGWLVAVNRHGLKNEIATSQWALSQLEFGTSEASLLSTTASILATHASNLDLFREKEQILISVVRSLVSAVEAKDQYTCGHSERVALFGRVLAEQIGCDEASCERLYLTGLLHDIGKIGVSDSVLKKEGKLTDEEFAEIMRHPNEGWAILQELEQLRYVLPGVLHHHEQVDGSGYPDNLKDKDIPLDGRLLAVVDAYDAMTSDRPYRKGMPAERAQQILREGAGTQWDAELIDAFFAALDRIERVRCNYHLRARPERTGKCEERGALVEVDPSGQ